nr:hypothetical protein CFP56_57616 [Quercus suber]
MSGTGKKKKPEQSISPKPVAPTGYMYSTKHLRGAKAISYAPLCNAHRRSYSMMIFITTRPKRLAQPTFRATAAIGRDPAACEQNAPGCSRAGRPDRLHAEFGLLHYKTLNGILAKGADTKIATANGSWR